MHANTQTLNFVISTPNTSQDQYSTCQWAKKQVRLTIKNVEKLVTKSAHHDSAKHGNK